MKWERFDMNRLRKAEFLMVKFLTQKSTLQLLLHAFFYGPILFSLYFMFRTHQIIEQFNSKLITGTEGTGMNITTYNI